tara:strand:- start:1530 stop:1997 length:468 start_codon:yes stop_codon:yes gene_type:complete
MADGKDGLSVEFGEGNKNILKNLLEIGQVVDKRSAKILNDIAQPRATKMKERVPVMTGDLKSSIHVSEPKVTRKGAEVKWVAGGSAMGYAVVVHEDMLISHSGEGVYYPSPGVKRSYTKRGQAKFLISVVNEDAKAMKKEMAEEFDKAFMKFDNK